MIFASTSEVIDVFHWKFLFYVCEDGVAATYALHAEAIEVPTLRGGEVVRALKHSGEVYIRSRVLALGRSCLCALPGRDSTMHQIYSVFRPRLGLNTPLPRL